ncbi:MAG: hypothetical protein ACREVP_16640 [Burkholderiales bacterium]
MARGRLTFVMPAPSTEAFDAFFNHSVRLRWDTLLKVNYVEGGGTHPYVGAISTNLGRGWKRGLSMRTRFLTYDPPRQASAELVEPTGPFALWAASLRFLDRDDQTCDLIYTYAIKLRPRWFGTLLDPFVKLLFAWETRRRFKAMAQYLRQLRGSK